MRARKHTHTHIHTACGPTRETVTTNMGLLQKLKLVILAEERASDTIISLTSAVEIPDCGSAFKQTPPPPNLSIRHTQITSFRGHFQNHSG